ncbi:hypothetical protein E4U42_001384 [Claviceps africana]|uniref:Glycosyl transferase 64 domain-containing protein n=1 Tax=Claviceps africana TaxID=83212 RepID=A0A8K0JAQ3_9HYPO|nr:hypothetical protein E4U42_001384 [Claviceps africana]
MDSSSMSTGIRFRLFKRIAVTVFAFVAAAGIALTLFTLAPEEDVRHITQAVKGWEASFKSAKVSKCPVFNDVNKVWQKSLQKYQHLPDDKFTVTIQTYRRPKELKDTLEGLLSDEIPSLVEVVVVWNDLETTPPDNYVSKHGVPVRYRKSPVNSLNQKLWPDPAYQTQAIFLCDDDIYYKPRDLEFVFQSWRKFGRHRMTGGFTRCAVQNPATGNYTYTFCSTDDAHNNYNLILTGLAFAHISFLDYYSSDDALSTKIRAYVDEHFNCEDLAMNYMVSMLTGEGPLCVKGKEKYVSMVPKTGISVKPGHMETRTQCLNDFNNFFGCMPLIQETAHIDFGVILA